MIFGRVLALVGALAGSAIGLALPALGCVSIDRQAHDRRTEQGPPPRVAPPGGPERLGPPPAGAPASATPEPARAPALASPAPNSAVPRAYYPFHTISSPLGEGVSRRLYGLVREHPGLDLDSFSKIGDSISASSKFMACFANPEVSVASAASTLTALRSSAVDSFARKSLSAENGWSAWQPLAGSPAPLVEELSATRARFAFLMLGTNDMETSSVTTFTRRLIKLVDALLARGVVPLMSTLPERRDRAESRLKVPRFNAAIRAVAQAREVPLLDLNYALSKLPSEGLSSDGIHPSVYQSKGATRACDFGSAGLKHGYNVRNLLSLELVHRVRSVMEGSWAIEATDFRPLTPGALALSFSVKELPLIDTPDFVPSAAVEHACSGELRRLQAAPPGEVGRVGYEFLQRGSGPLEVLALSAGSGASLRFALVKQAQPDTCQMLGRGFKRSLIPAGRYTLWVEGSLGPSLIAVLQGRASAS